MDRLVHRAQRPLEPQPPQQRDEPRQRPARPAREQQHAEHHRPDDERGLDPDVRADAVATDREQEADRGERDGRCSSERTLEQHGPGDGAGVPGMPLGALVDAHRVAADRRRQDLPGGVRREVRPDEPRSRSWISRAASSRCQRHAIGQTVPPMIASESRNHPGDACESTCHVFERSIFETMYASASPVTPRVRTRRRSRRRIADQRRRLTRRTARGRAGAPRSRRRCPRRSAPATAAATAPRRRRAPQPGSPLEIGRGTT